MIWVDEKILLYQDAFIFVNTVNLPKSWFRQ